jgi:polar amino acid transport system substrate-binding protein
MGSLWFYVQPVRYGQEKDTLKGTLFFLLVFSSSFLYPAMLHAADQTEKNGPAVVLLTLEWPPYTGLKLPANGFISQRVRAAYAALNQDIRIGFFSWRRTIRLPYTDKRFLGYFPTYPSAERKQLCNLSDPIGVSSVGLAELRKKPLQWKRVEDLEAFKIGTVTAYANQELFDKLVTAGSIKTSSSDNDVANLLNLVRGHVDAAIIDINVLAWLLKNEPRLQPYKDQIQLNERLLTTWPLFVCFRKDAEGAVLRDRFNAGLAASLHSEAVPTIETPNNIDQQTPEKPAQKRSKKSSKATQ